MCRLADHQGDFDNVEPKMKYTVRGFLLGRSAQVRDLPNALLIGSFFVSCLFWPSCVGS